MRRPHIFAGLLVTALAGLLLASGTPANATHPVAGSRIADLDARSFATASTTTQLVTMQPPSTVVGPQHWTLSDTGQGTKVTNIATGGCLGLPDRWITVNLPPVVQQPCRNRATDYWKIVSTTTDTVIFQNVGHGGCMGLDSTASTSSTQSVATQQYSSSQLYVLPCRSDDPNQHFRVLT
jgi:hypothetical protein